MTTPVPAPTDSLKPSIQVFDRMFALLDVLAQSQQTMGLKELTQATGLHASTVHRILNDLAFGRYVERTQPGMYRLGLRFLELGNVVKSRMDVREAALGPMRELHEKIGQPVNLSVRQGDAIVYVERAYSMRSGMQVVRAIGGRAPLHLTSVGKLFLAQDSEEKLRSYAQRTGLKGQTPSSIVHLDSLREELLQVVQSRVAYDKEELELGVSCIASGVCDDHGELVAGLSISAPTDRLQQTWLADLMQTAQQISKALGAPRSLH